MDDSDEFDTPEPPNGSAIKIEDEENPSIVPLKRKPSQDFSEDQTQSLSASAEAQRAYLVRSVPHVFDGNGSNGSQSPVSPASPIPSTSLNTVAASTSRSASSSARPSPNPSEEEGIERGGSLGLSEVKSRHIVPKGFRGPLPRIHDAEEVAPIPVLTPVPGTSLFNTLNYPYNRNGYHYITAGPASEHLPTSVYRTLETEPRGVHWSWIDRSPFTHISQDASIVSSHQGFRSARANVPVREGSWYVELHILPPETAASTNNCMKDGPHVRLGWSRREAGLNAPVGMNGYSYGMRDTTGEKVFLSRTYQYGKSFGPGSVVGMYISLPKARKVNAKDAMDPARIARKRIPIRYKGRLYFETLEYPVSKEMEHLMERSRRGEKLKDDQGDEDFVNAASGMLIQPQNEEIVNASGKKKRKNAPGPGPSALSNSQSNLRPLPTLGPDSQIGFFIDGEPQGIAFENLLDFRPLRKQGNKTGSLKTNSTSLGLSEEGQTAAKDSIITTTSSLASILKSRENGFDDGLLGYFPFVSVFGGARVQLVPRAEDFLFPPPANIREVLESVNGNQGVERKTASCEEICRPLEERYEEYLQEVWKHDLADEERAKVNAHLLKVNGVNDDDDDDDEAVAEQPQQKKSNPKKSKKRGTPQSHQNSPRNASTPLRDEHVVEVLSRSGIHNEIKQDDIETMPTPEIGGVDIDEGDGGATKGEEEGEEDEEGEDEEEEEEEEEGEEDQEEEEEVEDVIDDEGEGMEVDRKEEQEELANGQGEAMQVDE